MNSYQQLQLHERRTIFRLHKADYSSRYISAQIGRSHTTVSRELKRPTEGSPYNPEEAQDDALQKRSLSRRKIKGSFALLIIEQLKLGLSPDQIIMRNSLLGVSTQAIYDFIWRDFSQGGALWKLPRHCGKGPRVRFYRRPHGRARRLRNAPHSIDFRPKSVDSRLRFGHWEADLVEPRGRARPLLVLIERKSRFTLSGFLQGKWSEEVARVSQHLLKGLKVLSVTCDNGPEFLDHKLISSSLQCKVYYAHPYKSWQKGAVENVNKLYRQFFPKGSSFSHLSIDEPLKASTQINNRPRRSLQNKTPNSLLKHLLINP